MSYFSLVDRISWVGLWLITSLKDNYEYSVNTVSEISYSGLLKSNGLLAGDPLLKQWVEGGGPYATNGYVYHHQAHDQTFR